VKKTKIAFYILSLIVISNGIFIRFWHLDTIPPGIHYDEAFNGLNAIGADESGHYRMFYAENFGREGLHINVIAFFIQLFGISNFSLRLANASWGALTLIGFFFLLKQLKFSPLAVLAGTFMLAFSFWHLDFSRTAYRGIMVPLLEIWIFYFFLKGLEAVRHKNFYFIISAILLGLGFYTYIAFRIFPLAVIILAIAYLLTRKEFLRNYWKSALIFFLVSLIAAAPILIYFTSHKKDMIGRSETVSIFDDPATPWTVSFKKSFVDHMGAFFIHGDNNPRYNYNSQPLLPPVWQLFFFLGFIISFKEIIGTLLKRQPSEWFYVSVLAQSTFWIMFIPGVLSIEGIPHTLRIIGTIPGVFIMAILPLEYLLDRRGKRKQLFKENKMSGWRVKNLSLLIFGTIVLMAISGLIQSYVYFGAWAKDLRTLGGYEKKLYDFGQLIRELPVEKNNYLILTSQTAISGDHKESSFKTTEYIAYPKIKEYLFFKPISKSFSVNCEENIRIIFFESDRWLRDQYAVLCPNLKIRFAVPKNGLYGFWVIEN